MKHLDAYFRAFLRYKDLTTTDSSCNKIRLAIAQSNPENDNIEVKRAFCTVDEEWVIAIEKGLVHIEKCIKEERQFIRSNGEVVPIEKVKKISKETTTHLAKHSNLISKYTEGEDIIPDKLYMVERLSDYAVYENRFLYMLLCFLRDFIAIRYDKILELTNKYDAQISINKSVVSGKRKLKYTLLMEDVRRDDDYLKQNNPAKDILSRIDLILKAVLAFLATPLMLEAAKVPMLKPPITKTNVLKMDNNFKGAVALYDYVNLYTKPGYTIENKLTTLSPFSDELAEDMAEASALISFLGYQYGLGIKQELKDNYYKEEERLKSQAIKERADRIVVLKRKLEKTGQGLEDYIYEIEKQLNVLEGEYSKIEGLIRENTENKETIKQLKLDISLLNNEVKALNTQIADERHNHFVEIQTLKENYQNQIHDLIVKHEETLQNIENERQIERENHLAELQRQKDEFVSELENQRQSHLAELQSIKDFAEKQILENNLACENAVKTANTEKADILNQLNDYKQKYQAVLDEKRIESARVKALGGIDREYTDKYSFDELEREYLAFTRIYKEQWAKSKKRIRGKLLNKENFKGKKETDNNSD